MINAIHMPEWLIDFWTVYGDMITPILTTLLMALTTALALKIRTDAKLNNAKADLQIQALKDVANREDNKPELNEQKEEIKILKQSIIYLGDMFSTAFANSSLDPQVKQSLEVLKNKITYGNEEDLVKELEDTNQKLKEEVDALKSQLAEKAITVVESEVNKRIRR